MSHGFCYRFPVHSPSHRPRQAFLDWIDSLRPKVVVVKRPPEPLGVRQEKDDLLIAFKWL